MRAQSSRLSGAIDSGQLIELPQSIPSGAQTANDIGPLDPSTAIQSISLVFKPSEIQQQTIGQLLADQRNPGSPDYHRWLNPFQFADRFGLSPNDYAAITKWLDAQGFSITYAANGRNWLAFSGSAAQAARVFRTTIHRFQVDGRTHFANTTNISVPAALINVIAGVRGLDDFHPQPVAHVKRSLVPEFTAPSGAHYLAPGDIAAIYDINALYANGITGAGQSIVVAGQTDVYTSDIASFRSLFGLSPTLPRLVLYGADPGVSSEDLIEADLDLEWSGAAAPNASIIYVYSSDVFDSVFYAVDQSPVLAPVISLSYGGCENENRSVLAELRSVAQQANAEGITWVASAGDSGAAACDSQSSSQATGGLAVNVPASIPEVTAVGGTDLSENGGTYWGSSNNSNYSSARGYIPEIAWNDTVVVGVLNASGGGTSISYPAPLWQTGAGFLNSGFREVPDLALSASGYHDAYLFCTGGECANGELGVVGGTSAGTPIVAAVVALLNQYLTSSGVVSQSGLGNINPALYQLAQSTPQAFHDITMGSNVVPCRLGTPNCANGSFGFYAGAGYDQVTGLGSIDVYNLVTSWTRSAAMGQIPAVSTLPVSALGITAATLNGSVNPNGLDTQVWFEYGTSASLLNGLTTAQQDIGSGASVVPYGVSLTGLTAGTQYYYQVQASNSDGVSQGQILSFATAVPGIVQISGQISLAGGGGVPNVMVSATSGPSTLTDSSGNYTLSVTETLPVIVTPVLAGYSFSPASETFPTLRPSGNLANFSAAPVPESILYLTASPVNGGTLQPQSGRAFATGSIVAVTATENAGWTFAGWTGSVANPNSSATTIPVTSTQSITAKFIPQQFSDVTVASPFFDAVNLLSEQGITNGCTVVTYCPDDTITRAQMAIFIVRSVYGGDTFTLNQSTPYFVDVPTVALAITGFRRCSNSVSPPDVQPDITVRTTSFRVLQWLLSSCACAFPQIRSLTPQLPLTQTFRPAPSSLVTSSGWPPITLLPDAALESTVRITW